jgi:hypothetical protein
MTRKAHAHAHRSFAVPTPAINGERGDALILSVLDVVPLPRVIELLGERVREANRADQMLAVLTLRGERAKPRIEARSGPSWSTEEVAAKLGKTSETVRAHIADGKLVGYTADGDRTRWRLPAWQLEGAAPHAAPHAWVPRLIAAFGANGWGLLDFLTAPREGADAAPDYLHLLLEGRVEDVIAAARRANPD